MATATATLFYGIFVSTPSLIFAADAQVYLEGPLDFINSILFRQSNPNVTESINTDKKVAICMTVPLEIWNMIKKELLDAALKQSEQDFIKSCSCTPDESCGTFSPFCSSCGEVHDGIILDRFCLEWSVPGCADCYIEAESVLRDALIVTERFERVEKLLKKFGLKLQSTHQIKPKTFINDFISLSPITILLDDDKFAAQEIDTIHEYDEGGPGNTVKTISPTFINSGYKNYSEHKLRFERLRKEYKIKARDPMPSQNFLVEMFNRLGFIRESDFESGINCRWLLWLTTDMEEY